ncbi:MAG: efflux RND transporter periplasmic adaptor subunit [Pseudomonadales bacterium]
MSYLIKRILAIAGILGIATAIAVGLFLSRPEPEQKPAEISAPLVDLIELEAGPVHFTVDSQGSVQPLTETTLSAEVTGAIIEMADAFLGGGAFRAGDVLLHIDPVNYQSALARAEATVSQRQVEYDGALRLRDQGFQAESQLLSAKAALAVADADLVRARRDLARTMVRAPYDGIVRERRAQLGDYVTPGTQLGTVFATAAAEVRLPLPDNQLAFADLPLAGQTESEEGPAVALTGTYRGRPARWQARIVRTEGVIDERNRMVYAVARIEDPYRLGADAESAPPLPVGTFVKAQVDGITLDDVVRIPRALVRGGNRVMFVDEDLSLRFRTLDFLRTDAEYAYLAADQLTEWRVLATTLEAPLNGMTVRVGSGL